MAAAGKPTKARRVGDEFLEILTATQNFGLVEIDASGTITDRQGPLLDWLEIGADAADALPFIVGLEGEAAGSGNEDMVSYMPNLSLVGGPDRAAASFAVYLHRRAEPRGISILLQDTTDKSAMEQRLLQSRNELRMTQSRLVAAKETAENATKLKDKFVSLVAHDLKTPIASTVQVLELLRGRYAEALDASMDALMQSELAGCRRALETIEQLLDVDRLRSGVIEPHMTRVDLRARVDYAAERCAQAAAAKQIALQNDVSRGVEVAADPALLDRVLANVVDNAVKFCRAGDTIRFFVANGERGALAIEDSGVGIETTRTATLFDLASNSSTPGTARERGTGLGLPLSRELMQAQGGDIEIDSLPGTGTTVLLRFVSG